MSKAGTGHREGCSVPAFSAIIKRKIIDTYRAVSYTHLVKPPREK